MRRFYPKVKKRFCEGKAGFIQTLSLNLHAWAGSRSGPRLQSGCTLPVCCCSRPWRMQQTGPAQNDKGTQISFHGNTAQHRGRPTAKSWIAPRNPPVGLVQSHKELGAASRTAYRKIIDNPAQHSGRLGAELQRTWCRAVTSLPMNHEQPGVEPLAIWCNTPHGLLQAIGRPHAAPWLAYCNPLTDPMQHPIRPVAPPTKAQSDKPQTRWI